MHGAQVALFSPFAAASGRRVHVNIMCADDQFCAHGMFYIHSCKADQAWGVAVTAAGPCTPTREPRHHLLASLQGCLTSFTKASSLLRNCMTIPSLASEAVERDADAAQSHSSTLGPEHRNSNHDRRRPVDSFFCVSNNCTVQPDSCCIDTAHRESPAGTPQPQHPQPTRGGCNTCCAMFTQMRIRSQR